jgi:hypothetical protein
MLFLVDCSKRSGCNVFEGSILYSVVLCSFRGWWVVTEVAKVVASLANCSLTVCLFNDALSC